MQPRAVFAAAALLAVATTTAQAQFVGPDPDMVMVDVGDSFSFDVFGTDFPMVVDGGNITLTYNSNIIQFTDVAIFVNPPWDPTLSTPIAGGTHEISDPDGDGIVTVSNINFGSFAGPSGAFDIATVTFEAVGSGFTEILLGQNPDRNPFASGGVPIEGIEFGIVEVTVTGVPDGAARARIDEVLDPNPPVVDLGEFHVGDAVTPKTVAVSNTAEPGSDNLNATIAGTSGDVIASGSFDGLVPGGTNDTDITVSIDTSSSGMKSGTATLGFVSENPDTGDTRAPESVTPVPPDVPVTAKVFALAAADLETPGDLGDRHLGDEAKADLRITNTGVGDPAFQEFLDAAFTTTTTGDVSGVAGAVDNLAPGATSDGDMTVTLDTSTVGNKSGTAEVMFTSDPNGINSLGTTDLGTQEATVTATVWRLAEAEVDPTTIDFGTVRVGDVATGNVNVSNTAADDGFSENLKASSADLAGGPLTIAPGQMESFLASLDTSTAGVKNDLAVIDLMSDGDGLNSLGQTLLGSETISLIGTVNAIANPLFQKVGGDGGLFSDTDFILDFGIIAAGSDQMLTANLSLLNDVVGPADNLEGTFDLSGLAAFLAMGFEDFTDLAPGAIVDGLMVMFDPTGRDPGNYLGSIVLNPTSVFDGLSPLSLGPVTLNLAAVIRPVDVPEPITAALFIFGLAGLGAAARRRAR